MVLPEWRGTEEIIVLRRCYEYLFDQILAEGIEYGELRPVHSPRLAVFAIVGMFSSAAEWFSPAGRLSAEEIGEAFAGTALVGFRH